MRSGKTSQTIVDIETDRRGVQCALPSNDPRKQYEIRPDAMGQIARCFKRGGLAPNTSCDVYYARIRSRYISLTFMYRVLETLGVTLQFSELSDLTLLKPTLRKQRLEVFLCVRK